MRFTDLLPPVLTRRFQRKDLSGSIDFLPGLAAWLQPLGGPSARTGRSYERMAQEGMGANVYLYRGVTLITQTEAGIPWKLFRTQANGDRDEQEGHPILTLLNIQANEDDSGPELIEAFEAYRLLAGIAYLWAVRPDTGNRPPTKLYPIQPNLLRPEQDREGNLVAWVYQAGQ